MKVLFDMNLPPILSDIFSNNGFASTHWSSIGDPGAKDSEILAYARAHEYIIITCDLDFSTILSVTHGQKPSVVQVRTHGFRIEALSNMLASTLNENSTELENGAILSIDAKKSRVRLLPL